MVRSASAVLMLRKANAFVMVVGGGDCQGEGVFVKSPPLDCIFCSFSVQTEKEEKVLPVCVYSLYG